MFQNKTIALTLLLICVLPLKGQQIVAENAKLEVVSTAFQFTEGPASDKEGNVYFTDQPNNRIHKWHAKENTISTFLENAGRSNGLYFNHQGDLLACADEKFELWRIDPLKKKTVLVSTFKNQKLNGPNDLWVTPTGGIYFTDPYYQRPYWKRTKKEMEKEQVYYIDPKTKNVRVVASDLVKPNGIIGSADAKTLYIADIGDSKTYRYTINPDGTLSNKTLFAAMGSDGMTIDNHENLYLTGKGVSVFNSKGDKIHHINVDQDWTANVTFGGQEQNTLFITAMNAVYTLQMKVKGVRY